MPPQQQQQDDDFSQYKVQPGGEEDFSQYKAERPPASSRLGEIGSGIWRGLKSIPEGIGEAAKPRNEEEVQYGPTGRVLLHMGQDFMGGLERGKEARDKSKASGEGWAGQTLSTLENYPVIGGMVKHAELGGPHMFSPESLGAAAEGSTLAAAPELGKRVAEFAPEAAKATVRGVAKGTNKVLDKAPGSIGAAVGAGIGSLGGPVAATAGGALGLEVGREVLPKLKIPGEDFGRPKPQMNLFSSEPALVRGGRALGRKIGSIGRGLVGDETEAEALHDTIAHGEPIGKPLAGHSAGAPSDQPLPTDPKFTENGEKLAVEFPKPKAAAPEIAAPKSKAALSRTLGDQLGKGLGVEPPPTIRPGVKIGQQFKSSPAADVEPGHTPVDSSVVKSFKYDPEKQEMHIATKAGTTYIAGEVTPEQVEAFKNADSPGKAWNELRKNSTPVAKIVNGKRVALKPTDFRSVSPDDLTDALQESLEQEKKKRGQ